MRRWTAGLGAAALGVAWWAGAAPAVHARIVALRDSAKLVYSGSGAIHRGRSLTAAEVDAYAHLHARSEDWPARAASLLTAEQRAQGVALSAGLKTPPAAPPRLLSIESDLWGLSQAILDRYGATLGAPPAVPAIDPWQGRGRRDRVLALMALLEADALSAEQAADLLALTLETLQAQAALADLEAGEVPPLASPIGAEPLEPAPDNTEEDP